MPKDILNDHRDTILAVLCVLSCSLVDVAAQQRATPAQTPPGATSYLVSLGQRPVGREEVTIVPDAEGWLVRGSSQLGVPIEVTTRHAEVRYDANWRPRSLLVEGVTRGDRHSCATHERHGR